MKPNQNDKPYNLEKRTFQFAKRCRKFVRSLPKDIINVEDGRQLVRASGSIASNYIEAAEAISKKDSKHRMKVCLKESRESNLWLELLEATDSELKKEKNYLENESMELSKIFGAIVRDNNKD